MSFVGIEIDLFFFMIFFWEFPLKVWPTDKCDAQQQNYHNQHAEHQEKNLKKSVNVRKDSKTYCCLPYRHYGTASVRPSTFAAS
jgi:hypothetical protein